MLVSCIFYPVDGGSKVFRRTGTHLKHNVTLLKAVLSFLKDVRALLTYVSKYFVEKFTGRLDISVRVFAPSFKTMHTAIP
jgi:hypothetical protein